MIRGTVISRRRDSYGEIVVAEDKGVRSLYFGEGVLQSSLLPATPETLVTDCSQAMAAVLIFRSAPASILLIGLGGCSLVHFLLKAVPGCSLDVVEIRQQVIDLAGEFFLLSGGDGRVRVVREAGEDFVGREGCGRYDLILVDAFDDEGPAAALLGFEFLSACRGRLKEGGIFAINLWNRPKDNFPALFAGIRDVFGDNTVKLLLGEAYRNAIVFGFEDPAMPGDLSAYRAEAKRLQREGGVNFPMYLRWLYWQNLA